LKGLRHRELLEAFLIARIGELDQREGDLASLFLQYVRHRIQNLLGLVGKAVVHEQH